MRSSTKQFVIVIAGLIALAFFCLAVVMKTNAITLVAIGFAVVGFTAFILWPDIGTYIGLFIIHTNLSVILYKFHGVPQAAAGATWLTICVPFAIYVFVLKRKVMIDYTLMLMFAFLLFILMSYFMAVNKEMAMGWITTYFIEGIVLYFIFINIIRSREIMRKSVWALMISGTLLGSLTLYQEVTKTYDNNFFGFAQRQTAFGVEEIEKFGAEAGERTKVRRAHRADGPIGDPNRYSQIMLLIFPLVMFRVWSEKSIRLKILAVIGTLLTLSGILLTYSRGAFVTLCAVFAIMTFLRYIKISQVMASLVVFLIVVSIASPGYFGRIATIGGIEGLFSQEASHETDTVIKSRTTEMLAAFTVFLDYPILGVGPQQYTKFYSEEYMANPDIAFKHIKSTRAAHSLYFQMMAELGLLGFGTFMLIVMFVMYELWKGRVFWKDRDPELANYATGCILGITTYMTTSIFLSFAYHRYYFMIIAISGAVIQLLNSYKAEELAKEKEKEMPVEAASPVEMPETVHPKSFA